ncbi:MAG: hypothetical protein E7299_08145 [Lachnospiraceae bacterium]|nr:hypothetical protein [Lachnospiraceae bacterium]
MGNWEKIKIEYITTDISYRKLAEKYGVSPSSVAKRMKNEKWTEKRKQTKGKSVAKAIAKVEEREADKMVRLLETSEEALEKVVEALKDVDKTVVKNKKKTVKKKFDTKTGKVKEEQTIENEDANVIATMIDSFALKQLTSALKDLKDIFTANKGEGEETETGVAMIQPISEDTETEESEEKSDGESDMVTSGETEKIHGTSGV